jgi:predicted  nucleic acid-binding Zn-ribbon protein
MPQNCSGYFPIVLEIDDTRNRVSLSDTSQNTASILTLIEKRYLTEECTRLKEEVERLRHELADERGKRESERSEFIALIRQNQDMVKHLTNERQQRSLRRLRRRCQGHARCWS